eukprot:PhF_6_TR37655/c0_g1_i1/m.56033/K08592/SENP1; sentrin-specific protease 1
MIYSSWIESPARTSGGIPGNSSGKRNRESGGWIENLQHAHAIQSTTSYGPQLLTSNDILAFQTMSLDDRRMPVNKPEKLERAHPSMVIADKIIDDVVKQLTQEIVVNTAGPYANAFDDVLSETFLALMVSEAITQVVPLSVKKSHGIVRHLRMESVLPHLFPIQRIPVVDDTDATSLDYLFSTRRSDTDEVVKYPPYSIKRIHMRCLAPQTWLNDQIINCFTAMCCASTNGNTVFLGSFLLTKYKSAGASGVQRWFTKMNLTGLESRILIPINVSENHWALGAIHFASSSIEYYDSMSRKRPLESFPNTGLLKSLCEEIFPAKQPWTIRNTVPITPQQANGYDCGVFTCHYAYELCKNPNTTMFECDRLTVDASRDVIALNMWLLKKS